MPTITSRAAWGANPAQTPAGTIATPSPNLWLHHTASTGIHGAAGMRQLQQGARSSGYVDIEYSYVVDTDGAIYEARGIGRDSAAQGAPGHNNNATAHAICAMGNYDPATGNQQPTGELLNSIGWLVGWLHDRGAIAQRRITGPHREVPGCSTACCGQNLIARIGEINTIAGGSSSGSSGSTPAPGEDDDMPGSKDFVDALTTAEGAYKLQYDGGVQTVRGPFYGSYFTLAASVRNDPSRRFLSFGPTPSGGKGYSLMSTRGELYDLTTRQ